jgi:PDZ domain-containing protein
MLTTTLLLIALLCAGVLIKVPYAEMSPGPTVNTLGDHGGAPVLNIKDHKTFDTAGHLNMTTVRVTGADYRMNLVEAVGGWLSHDNAVVPHSTLYPEDKSPQQVDQQNAEEFSASQESAKVAALKQLHIKVSSHIVVGSVVKGGAAQGKLHAGDIIRAVDGKAVKAPQQVAKLVTKHKPGQKVTFTVIPKSKAAAAQKAKRQPSAADARPVVVGTKRAPGDHRAIVGIQPATGHAFPFPIQIKLADVGGPSAGLMFALGIVDKLTPEDLTGGSFVAGTGTIDDGGKVGPIGGIEMKTVAARDKGAKYFFTPAGNCAAAAKDKPDGLTLVKTRGIGDALNSLKKIRHHDTSALPHCAAG